MPSPWRLALLPALAMAAFVAGGAVRAQMESGDRGIRVGKVMYDADAKGDVERIGLSDFVDALLAHFDAGELRIDPTYG